MGRVPQHDIAKVCRLPGGKDGPPEAVLIELGKHTGMVDMCVGQKHRVDFPRRHRQGHIFEDVDTLFHAAVHQVLPASHLQQCTAARDLVGRTDELDFHGITSGIVKGFFPLFILYPDRMVLTRKGL